MRFQVNGKEVEVEVEPRLTLADCLRHHLRLTGTHVGCEHGGCGACTIIVDWVARMIRRFGKRSLMAPPTGDRTRIGAN